MLEVAFESTNIGVFATRSSWRGRVLERRRELLVERVVDRERLLEVVVSLRELRVESAKFGLEFGRLGRVVRLMLLELAVMVGLQADHAVLEVFVIFCCAVRGGREFLELSVCGIELDLDVASGTALADLGLERLVALLVAVQLLPNQVKSALAH